MRIAVLSDIHGNVTAFEAVLSDLRTTSPDLILHGGDLTVSGSSSSNIIDQVRAFGWQGVVGNTDEMLVRPHTFEDFCAPASHLQTLWTAVREVAAAAREDLGDDRLAWIATLPQTLLCNGVALVNASPASTWRAPSHDASDEELASTYADLKKPVTIYGHIHRPYIRTCANGVVIDTGSVSLSYDGDPRASYLILDDSTPTIRRVEYDVEKEVNALIGSRLPHAHWIARTLQSASPQMP